jgi:hypothetical protein
MKNGFLSIASSREAPALLRRLLMKVEALA